MKRIIIVVIFIVSAYNCFAQHTVIDGEPRDSCIIAFNVNDSLTRKLGPDVYISLDTVGTALWSIGTSSKLFFSSGGNSVRGIMTDTGNTYPLLANDWFTIKMNAFGNAIITFRHKWETTENHDGGIVEFSLDTGNTWHNAMDSCNVTASSELRGVRTDSFYRNTDTLLTGEMAFSGTSTDWVTSKLQFFTYLAEKTTQGWRDDCLPKDSIFIRFRFKSDDTIENLDGWIIDNIKIEMDDYGAGEVSDIFSNSLPLFPNPSTTGIFQLPKLNGEEKYRIDIVNALGVKILSVPYTRSIDLSAQPKGIYFYRATNGEITYTGKLQVE